MRTALIIWSELAVSAFQFAYPRSDHGVDY